MEFEIWLTFLAAAALMSLFPGIGAVATMGESLKQNPAMGALLIDAGTLLASAKRTS